MRRIKLEVQYDGTDYAGWQWQENRPTIQGELRRALAAVLGQAPGLAAAGRTDAGVHALGQVVTLDTDHPIPAANLQRALNDRLPPAVYVESAEEVAPEFHPRFSARGKLYCYRVLNRPGGSPFLTRYAWHVPAPELDQARMGSAAELLQGQHDFAAFRSAGSAVKSTVRHLWRLDLQRHGELLEAHFGADGFLYQMVRNLMGTLVQVGRGELAPAQAAELLGGRDRTQVGPPAPPQGLCLIRVYY